MLRGSEIVVHNSIIVAYINIIPPNILSSGCRTDDNNNYSNIIQGADLLTVDTIITYLEKYSFFYF